MFVLFVAAALALQDEGAPVVRHEYDKVKDVGGATVDLGRVLTGPEHAAGMAMSHRWAGRERGAVAPDADVMILFYSASEDWTFLKNADMAILAGDARIRPRLMDKERRIHFKVEGAPVTEQMLYRISFADMTAIGRADTVEIAAGPKRFALTGPQILAVRRCAAHLATDSAGSRKLMEEEAESERKAAAAQAVGAAARRERMDKLRAGMDEAVEKARKAASKLPKKRPDLREKARRRTFDAEVHKLVIYQNATQAEIDELLQAYPDFAPQQTSP